jgi:hypothetical protein
MLEINVTYSEGAFTAGANTIFDKKLTWLDIVDIYNNDIFVRNQRPLVIQDDIDYPILSMLTGQS